MSVVAVFFSLLYLALIVFIVWQVISALNRIARGVEDIAQSMRRIEPKGPQSS